MKAAVFYGREDLRVEEVPEPVPGVGQVKLRVGFGGICGSDLHTYFEPEANPYLPFEPHPLTGATMPQILGHELSGTVVEVGEDVEGIRVGDRGAVVPIVRTCGSCAACRNGMPVACAQQVSLGTNADGGGLAEYVVIGADQFHQLPENVDLRLGALVEPLAVGWHGVVRSNAKPGGSALVVGAGPVGIGAWYAFRAYGVDQLLVSEPNAERAKAIAALGATVVDPVNEDLAAAVAELTDGNGVDWAVEASGVGAGFESALACLAAGGRLSTVAVYEKSFDFQPSDITLREKEIVGAVGYRHQDFDDIIDAMSRGIYSSSGWVTEHALDDVEDAIRSLRGGTGSKILISAT